MATRQGKKVKVRVKNLFSRRRKKSSRHKDQVRLLKESEEPITIIGDDEGHNEEPNLTLNVKARQTTKSQKPKRRSVKLDVGDMLYGGQGDRETEPSPSGHTGTDSRRGEGARPGEEQDLDLRLVTKEDGEDSPWNSDETNEKVSVSTQLHLDSGEGENTQSGNNLKNCAYSDAEVLTRTGKDKKREEKSKKKRKKKVTFSPTSTKYIQLDASQEALDVCLVEEQKIKKKKSRKKKIKKRIRKAARLSWRYLLAGFRNMTLVTPFYVTTDTMQSVYSPQYDTSLVTPMYMTSYTGEGGYTQRYP
ncbi:uncharacterized protein LOC118409874 [Branchiostoma floridae]|uniref:Uncharacterized protein LOC118409874 n=1 Tax=Branchiostoma floridae TaxID=7739 RepID=A0A9J7KNK6_BRAFL|nr:uncharacterized protein LOC118409874 [Branchiostoma floridae]